MMKERMCLGVTICERSADDDQDPNKHSNHAIHKKDLISTQLSQLKSFFLLCYFIIFCVSFLLISQ